MSRPGGGGGAGSDAGQASIETVALAPLVALLLMALVLGLRGHRAGEAAGAAAHAAGIAALVGRDPLAAARAVSPDLDRDRLSVVRRDGRITVRVRASGPPALMRRFDAERTVVVPERTGP